MPHLIQLEYTIEEVGILSFGSTEIRLAYLPKPERVTQSHSISNNSHALCYVQLQTPSGCLFHGCIVEYSTTTRCFGINLTFARRDITTYTYARAQDRRVITHNFHFRCNKLFLILVPPIISINLISDY